ncbi:hypothetical protein WCD74_13025 [Actinomycetospora sp. OC33-EN08]|uniref:DNA-binding protein n=1 Tax=Actinomycetospora aurantiaca TaxID=3129233 RepID=A0ABU8MQI5_9PSEU
MNQKLSVADPGPKPDDRGNEQRRRHEALAAVHAALEDEAAVRARAAARTVAAAETAAWLGASLADLATVTGHSRQAARKRWPSLGPIARRRRWVGYHVEDVLWAADLAARAFPTTGVAEQAAVVRRALDAGDEEEPTARWRALDTLVDRDLRAVAAVDPAGLDDEAEFARHGCTGVVGYYDVSTGEQ